MITKLYVIRHAEAEGNLWRRAHGWYDGDLTPNGMLQAAALGERMRGERIDALYASPLARTMKTAYAVSRACGVRIIPEPGLRELAMGVWENMPWAALRRTFPDAIESFARTADWRAPGAEDVAELYRRTGDVLRKVLETHEGKTVCLVSHAIAIRSLCAHIYGAGLRNIGTDFGGMKYLPNASVSLFEYDSCTGAFRTVCLGDAEHTAGVRTFAARAPAGYEGRKPELWYRSAGGREDVERAAEAWHESWIAVHGSDEMFSMQSACRELGRIFDNCGESIRFAMLGEDEAGVLIIDPMNRADPELAHISLLMLHEKFRGYGLASQLIGEAAARARALGRNGLRLRVAEKNSRAISLYRRNGFEPDMREDAFDGAQLIMKRGLMPRIPEFSGTDM